MLGKKQRYRLSLSLISLALVLTVSGCITTNDRPDHSGFLSDYTGMYRSGEVPGLFLVKTKGVNLSDYTKFYVDPITIQMTRDAVGYETAQEDLKQISKSFHQDIKDELSKNYTVVDKPRSGVIRLRVAVTDILKHSPSKTKAIVEAEFLDYGTSKRVLAVMTSAKGMYLHEWAALLSERLDYLNSETKVYQFK